MMRRNLKLLEQWEWWALVALIYVIPLNEALKNVFWGVVVFLRLARLKEMRWEMLWNSSSRVIMPWLACGLLTSMFAIEPAASWKGMWDMIRGAVMFWIGGKWAMDERRRVALVRHLILASACASFWGLFEYGRAYLSAQIEHRELPYYFFIQLKSVGHFNQSGIYLAMAWLTALAATMDGRVFRHAIMGWICLVLIGLALLGTTARTSIGVSLLFSAWMLRDSSPARWTTWTALTLVGMGLVVVLLSPSIRSRVLYHGSFSSRASIWEPACKVAMQRSWTGVGLNNFKNIHLSSSNPTRYSTVDHAHNLYINTLVQMGFLGLMALLWLLGMLLRDLWHHRPSVGGDKMWFRAGIAVWSVVVLVGASNTPLHHELSMIFFLVMSLALGSRDLFLAGNPDSAATKVKA